MSQKQTRKDKKRYAHALAQVRLEQETKEKEIKEKQEQERIAKNRMSWNIKCAILDWIGTYEYRLQGNAVLSPIDEDITKFHCMTDNKDYQTQEKQQELRNIMKKYNIQVISFFPTFKDNEWGPYLECQGISFILNFYDSMYATNDLWFVEYIRHP